MLTRFTFLAASAAVLVSAQAPSSGCTTASFQIPSWFVTDFKYSTSDKSLSYSLLNRATNITENLTCKAAASGWNTCSSQAKNDALLVSAQVIGSLAQISVNETWTCNDRNGSDRYPFVAIGNTTVALTCNGDSCAAAISPLLIKASLLSPVAITPVYAPGPTGHANPGCAAAAASPSWTLSDIRYVNTTGEAPSEYFTFQLANDVIGYEASCIPGNTRTSLTCAGVEFQSASPDRYRLSTDASFDPDTFKVTLTQTWYCDDTDPSKPYAIQGTVSDVLPLQCTKETLEGSPAGVKTTCVATPTTLKGKQLSQTPLAPYSIVDPVLQADGCTISSVLRPQWVFSAFEIDSPAGATGGPPSALSFDVILNSPSRGFQFPESIYQGEPLAGSDSWYKCELGGGGNTGQPVWPIACSFQFLPATKQLTLKADWSCSEYDPDHPILFSGVATTTVKSPMTCDTVDGISQCVATDLSYSWIVDISNVTWVPQ
ncbi:hypothetical protein B0T24DRAFT_711682 [Lasiosphaeria ovina]|uniref:Ig-like domain-containing protein n=1 Tax=Lasiosphaeria ovina TaxID=92902 RepID=A0AAE0JXJ1_9PEZI|nr:hypothetical protein B0T24DRAFT_711682 [Lasiosphaeria ovina]